MYLKRVAIIGVVGVPAKYGGFETLAHNLVKQLKGKYSFTVYCSSYAYTEKMRTWEGSNLKYIPLRANGFQSIVYDMLSIVLAIQSADVVLLLGVSGALILPFLSKKIKRKVIVNVDGIEWNRNKWNKAAKLFLRLLEYLAVKHSNFIISDNEEIRRYVRNRYNKDSFLIEYGADHIANCINKHKRGKYAITVCRIEPENNIHLILESFIDVNIHIKIIGNWHQSRYGRELLEKYSIYENIELLPPIYNQQDLDLLRSNCWIYIHGHSAGGTNPSLVEAMYLNLPVLAFDVPYNRETTEGKAIFFKNKEELNAILRNINETELELIAKALRSIAERRYRWEGISNKYSHVIDATFDLE